MARNKDTVSQRHRLEAIRRELAGSGEVSVSAMAEMLGVSGMTIWRDIAALEQAGEVIRTHGGAASAKKLIFEFTFKTSQQKNLEAKRAIAAKALEHIKDGDVVLLDTGTTTLELAKLIAAQRKVTVITTSLAIVSVLQFVDDVETVILGGFLRKGSPDIHGPLTEQNLGKFRCDIAFVGADAADAGGNTFTDDLRVLNLDRLMQEIAAKLVVLADSTKFEKRAMCKVYNCDDYDLLITDSGLGARTVKALEKNGVRMEIAQSKQ